ncbi:hypothetical protein B488_08170 [Liberibacter crescens BT-1]|uniref:Uncharacterized protein n=1 Tax=Liberibacter crescens (strain BT-1) TaxID=1215343 RepID=L0ETE3_LIBCB|nr:hypothetical protein [Liberibacter crescens]AGA64809.1 hypothetical protein B488_08170 [Liberibacter crescens BT-1]
MRYLVVLNGLFILLSTNAGFADPLKQVSLKNIFIEKLSKSVMFVCTECNTEEKFLQDTSSQDRPGQYHVPVLKKGTEHIVDVMIDGVPKVIVVDDLMGGSPVKFVKSRTLEDGEEQEINPPDSKKKDHGSKKKDAHNVSAKDTAHAMKPAEEAGAVMKPAEEAGAVMKPAEEAGAVMKPAEEAGAVMKPAEEAGAAMKPAGEAGAAMKPAGEAEPAAKK